jgi:hypothetical protein
MISPDLDGHRAPKMKYCFTILSPFSRCARAKTFVRGNIFIKARSSINSRFLVSLVCGVWLLVCSLLVTLHFVDSVEDHCLNTECFR